jgi:hypothetical protein
MQVGMECFFLPDCNPKHLRTMSNTYDNTPKPMSTEQAMHIGEQTYEQNQKNLAKSLQLSADDDGKYSFFGIEIPRAIAPAINMAVAYAVGPISTSVANVAYHQTKSLASGYGHSPDAAHSAALTAELLARWGVILAVPISKFASANTKFGQDRYVLHRELKSVCEATGANYSHNHVVNAAFKEAHNRYTEQLTQILPSLMSLVPQAVYGLQMQRESKLLRDAEHSGTVASAAIDDIVKKHMTNLTSSVDKALEEQKLYEEKFKSFKTTHGREVEKMLQSRATNDKHKKAIKGNSEQELRDFFDKNVWKEARDAIRDEQKAAKSAANKASKPDGNEDKLINNMLYYAPIASVLGDGMAATIKESQKKYGKKATSYDLINKLKEQMQGKQSEHFVHEKVVEIFQQLEEDMGNTKFAGGLLEKLRDETKTIAEYIASGKLDALALVKIAGEDVLIKHGKAKTFQSQESVQKILDDMCCTQIIRDGEASEQEFAGRFSVDLATVKDALKKSLTGMADGPEKDFIMTIMPAEILEKSGITRDEIRTHRKHAHANLQSLVGASIIHIAALEEDLLKLHGMSAREIQSIKKISDQIMNGDMETLTKLVDSKDDLLTAVAAESLNEQIAGNAAVWTERVKEAASLDERLTQIKAEKEEKAAKKQGSGQDEGHMVERSHASREEKSHGHVDRHHKNQHADPDHYLAP